MMSDIACVIPVFNRLKYTQNCLQYLKDQENTSFFQKNNVHIILVNDGSKDNTVEWVSEHYPEVIILHGDGNLWYSGSLNMGFRYGIEELGCDFVMIWENDIFPGDNYFENLQEILEKWDGKSLITSKLYYKVKPDLIFGLGGTFDRRTGSKSLIGWRETDRPEYQKPMKVDWFLGHMALIHRDVILKIGYMDSKNFPQYHADIDFSLRATENGFDNMVYPNLPVLNDTETTGLHQLKDKTLKQFFASLTSIRSNYNIRKDLIFTRKHTTGWLPYVFLMKKYGIYTASFLKWKFLGWFGVKRKNEELLVSE